MLKGEFVSTKSLELYKEKEQEQSVWSCYFLGAGVGVPRIITDVLDLKLDLIFIYIIYRGIFFY